MSEWPCHHEGCIREVTVIYHGLTWCAYHAVMYVSSEPACEWKERWSVS